MSSGRSVQTWGGGRDSGAEGVTHLTVEAKQDDHDEEEDGPDRGQRHLSHGLGVGDERQSWSCNNTTNTLD